MDAAPAPRGFFGLRIVNLAQQAAFDQQGQRTIHRGTRDRAVDLARHVEQFLGREMFGRGEGRLDDHLARLRPAQTFAGQKRVEIFAYFGIHVNTP